MKWAAVEAGRGKLRYRAFQVKASRGLYECRVCAVLKDAPTAIGSERERIWRRQDGRGLRQGVSNAKVTQERRRCVRVCVAFEISKEKEEAFSRVTPHGSLSACRGFTQRRTACVRW